MYPDVMVVCGEPAYAEGHRDMITNPSVMVEVLPEFPTPDAAAPPPNRWRAKHYRPRPREVPGSFLASKAGWIFEGAEASGTRKASCASGNNASGANRAGPTQFTSTTAWQRFTIAGTLAAGQTGRWVVMRRYDSNGDDWTTGSIYFRKVKDLPIQILFRRPRAGS